MIILEAAGVTKGAFYYLFRSRADYRASLIAKYDPLFRARIAQSLERPDVTPLKRV